MGLTFGFGSVRVFKTETKQKFGFRTSLIRASVVKEDTVMGQLLTLAMFPAASERGTERKQCN